MIGPRSVGRLCLLLVACSSAVTQADGPREVVERYCQLDAEGARLGREFGREFPALMDPRREQIEPGWDAVSLIARYEVGAVRINGGSAHVTVHFHVIGQFAEVFGSQVRTLPATFTVVRRPDGWKIRQYATEPMVYPKTLQRHFASMPRWYNPVFAKDRDRRVLEEVAKAVKIAEQYR